MNDMVSFIRLNSVIEVIGLHSTPATYEHICFIPFSYLGEWSDQSKHISFLHFIKIIYNHIIPFSGLVKCYFSQSKAFFLYDLTRFYS